MRSIGAVGSGGLLGTVTGSAGAQTTESDRGSPRNVRVAEATPTSATIEWEPPAADAAVDHYDIEASGTTTVDTSSTISWSAVREGIEATSVRLDPVLVGVEGEVTVTAVGGDGTQSEAATVDLEVPPPTGESTPPDPADVKLTRSEDGPQVTWDPVEDEALSHYRLDVFTAGNPRKGEFGLGHFRWALDPDRTRAVISRAADVTVAAVDADGNVSPGTTVRVGPPADDDAGTVEAQSFEVTDRRSATEEDETAATVERRDETVTVTGTTTVPSGCHRPSATPRYDGRLLRVTVGVEQRPGIEYCHGAVEAVDYEAQFELDDAPDGVVVDYAGTEYRVIESYAEDVAAPSRPTGLDVTPTGSNSATASWDPVDHHALTHYVVWPVESDVESPRRAFAYRLPDPGPWYAVMDGETAVAIEDLAATEYTVMVQAVDVDGLRSPWAAVDLELPDSTGEEPAPIGGARPTDPDSDGHYEDVNGNGEIDYADVVTYFDNMDQPVMQNNVAAYDYNGNGDVDYADLVDLFQQV